MPRTVRSISLVLCAAMALLLAAAPGCDTGSTNPLPVGPDAAPAASNSLGRICTVAANDCPTSPAHACVTFSSIGSQAQGYCSPMCATPEDCSTGYTGPASGVLDCNNPSTPNTCTITCTTGADCPAGLACLTPMGAPFSFCVAPE